ncbi:hypothetical protein SUGI_0784370 [Cryptomeria japonica]|uniref:SCAR-like protein 2 isoform X2 n=1 Tax=Cryptomeria japonica TaxID=3369 RepID=UPI002414CE09|nr:SCAR-like protein 2 isoform X2 [Cryptomeria japonica]XP_057827571.2 SCAR-like protein 2 isoform X2 [Cryptomeria japonica]GLJ38492.1 hypothetical protein SUGI_0784370 [Cryptomeria japonica]
MPLVRYEIRNEYSLANSELYRSAGKDEPQALLEGVAMAGLVGIVRQLGDLAEFAAEIFHDLHEEVMATAARGHGLMIRVQQLEAEFPLVEKSLMSEKNQLRFAYAMGADWHASIRNDQNHLTQGDLPRFILNSYEECRGPPRLFLLDKFDVAGAGACLKRYTDPSFFKMEWASTELMKAEKAQRDKKARRVKKKGRRRRNGDTADVTPVNGRVRYSSLDLDHPKRVPSSTVNTSNQKLKSKEIDKSPPLKQQIERYHMKGTLNISSPQKDQHRHKEFLVGFDKKLNSKHLNASPVQDQVIDKYYVEAPYNKSFSNEDAQESSSRVWEEKPADRVVNSVKLGNDLTMVSSTESWSPRNVAEGISQNIIGAEQKDVLVHDERRPDIQVVENENDDVASEAENYMDALATMESETETDSETKTKQEVDFDINSEHKESGRELSERHAQYSEFANAEATAFYNCDSSDESSKVETLSEFFYKPADISLSAESMLNTVNATSECDSATVDINRRLDSGPLSLTTSKEDSAYAFDNGSSLFSETCKNVQVPLDEKVHELHAQCSVFTDAEDHALNNCDSLDKSSDIENSLGFFNSKPTDVSSNVESMPYTLNNTSECTSANVDQNRRLYTEHLSVGMSKDLDSSFDNEIPIHIEALENGQEALKNNQILLDEKIQMEADVTSEEGMLNGSDVPPVVDAASTIVDGNVGIDEFENEELSSAFQNKDGTGAFTNSAAIAGIDNAEVSFRFPTFESSLLSNEELQILHKEPAANSECFEGIESGGDLQTSSPEVRKDEDYGNYHSFSNSNIKESVDNSELAGSIENVVMQDNQIYIDLEANDEENEMLESIKNDSSDTQYVQLPSGSSSPELVGQISAESDLNIEFGEYSAESKPQDSLNDEYIAPGMDSDFTDEQGCPDMPLHHVPSVMQAIVAGELEEPTEYAFEKESPKSVGGFQDSDLAQSESNESKLYARSHDIPPQSNVLDGYQGNQIIENYSSNGSIIEDSIACSGVDQSVSSDGTALLFKNVVDDIPMKEVNFHSEEPVAVDSATVKFPFLACEADNACRKELSNEFPHVETSINNGVLPDGSPRFRSMELCNDGGTYENGINVKSNSNHNLREPTELFGSPPSANSFSKKSHTSSSRAEAEMQILYAIPPVKPNAITCHSRSIQNSSDGVSFENNVDTEINGNPHLVATEEFSSSVSANSFSETVYTGSLRADQDMHILHVIPPVKPVGAEPHAESPKNLPKAVDYDSELPSPFIPPVKPVRVEPHPESPKNLPKTEVYDSELPSPPLEHIKISFPPGSDSPLSMYSLTSDRGSESPSIERHQPSESKADNLSSSFHLLPEPAIPLHQADANQTIGIMGSLSSHGKRKSFETLSDKMHISQMRDTEGDSEDEGWKEFGKSSPEDFHEFYNQSLESTDGLKVFSGRTAVSDADTGSPGVLSTISRTSSLSPEETRNSLLNLKYSSADAGSSLSHSRNISLGSSPRSLAISEPHSPVSGEETFHRNQDLSWSHSPPLDTKASVQTFSTLESNSECNWNDMPPPPEICLKNEDLSRSHSSAFESGALDQTSTLEPNSECNFHQLPPPPPLLPSERQMMKSHQMSSLTFLGGEPPTPPALPPPLTMTSLIQDPSPSLVPPIQMSSNDQRDSLIEAIASHDKATLKKVPKDIHSISTKSVDEREELLEQIRTRSFNLRHTSVVKPNIPRPATNINVAAILEKANAIRQAFAGSDEDDEDDEDWSDT